MKTNQQSINGVVAALVFATLAACAVTATPTAITATPATVAMAHSHDIYFY